MGFFCKLARIAKIKDSQDKRQQFGATGTFTSGKLEPTLENS